ncbi:type II toxin-antitoxin system Phd/YefM family antitoxin [Chlorobium sp. BLA1]|uniref:type II toxin-antitoxin system Phd/YefM family antitoxin n=1 Tax=Candidatus Chlorobium masyuteum TaxID=2716876 RepID=UPI001423936C|nr:type II toxin-antitoxin system Phd/YefM family antitoxin [Candidatus Chlorobium masyuteum]NHQ60847.1 type II toxin-antitoxin system Phd/YefM family antitoxin [Candidatus Chlorobium masyuteum]
MIAISTTELRRNLRKYLDIANKERVIIQCGKSETYEIIPARKMSDTDRYFSDPKVVEHLQRSLQQVEEGKTMVLKKSDIKNLLQS